MTIAGALSRLQELVIEAGADVGVSVKVAPDAPIQSAAALPMSLVYITAFTGGAEDASYNLTRYELTIEAHFSAVSLRNAYNQINAIAPSLVRRLSGDPTLGGEVDTIIYPFAGGVASSSFDGVPTIGVTWTITVKLLDTHITS